MSTWKKNGFESSYDTSATEMANGSFHNSLANSPKDGAEYARNNLVRPKSILEKARMNVA